WEWGVVVSSEEKLTALAREYFADEQCVFRSIRSAIRICSINREPNFFYCFLTRIFVAFHYRVIFPH
ncbi:hypothetical protein LEH14_27695, partial [Salmonella enterica]|nr:hypothetical protein [Salmonella enterica]